MRYVHIKLPSTYTEHIDGLIQSGEFADRAEYVKELIRQDIRHRTEQEGRS